MTHSEDDYNNLYDDRPTAKSGLSYGAKGPQVVKQQSTTIEIAPTQEQKSDHARTVLGRYAPEIEDDGPDL